MQRTRTRFPDLVAALAAVLLIGAGCAGPRERGPAPSATALLQERFGTPARATEADGSLLLADLLVRDGAVPDRETVRAEVARHREDGLREEDALVAVATARGRWSYSFYGSLERLAARVEAGVPVLVQLRPDARQARARAFALVTDYDRTARKLRGLAQDGSAVEWEEGAFWRAWSGMRCWMMTTCAPDSARWALAPLERLSRVRFFDQAGRPEAGDAETAQLLESAGGNEELLVALASRERQRGRGAAAESLYRRVLALDAHHARAANNLAFLLAEQQRNLDEATDLVRRAILLEPGNPLMLDTLGFVLFQQKRYAEAATAFERAFARSRELPRATRQEIGFHLARAQLSSGQPHLARQTLARLREEDPGLLWPDDLANLPEPAVAPAPGGGGLDPEEGVR